MKFCNLEPFGQARDWNWLTQKLLRRKNLVPMRFMKKGILYQPEKVLPIWIIIRISSKSLKPGVFFLEGNLFTLLSKNRNFYGLGRVRKAQLLNFIAKRPRKLWKSFKIWVLSGYFSNFIRTFNDGHFALRSKHCKFCGLEQARKAITVQFYSKKTRQSVNKISNFKHYRPIFDKFFKLNYTVSKWKLFISVSIQNS